MAMATFQGGGAGALPQTLFVLNLFQFHVPAFSNWIVEIRVIAMLEHPLHRFLASSIPGRNCRALARILCKSHVHQLFHDQRIWGLLNARGGSSSSALRC